jgi:methylmalonyl-CoA/ethylmalonyl-CoA epimerase
MKIEKIDHICIAVKDLPKAQKTLEETFDLKLDVLYVAEREKIKVARYYVGEVALELMESTSPDGEVAKFLARRGEGVFLISFKISDVDAALAELKQKGIRLIDQEPRSLMGHKFAFIHHPKDLWGLLAEVIE